MSSPGDETVAGARASRPVRNFYRRESLFRNPAAEIAGMATIRVGISGWRYQPWREVFYPEGLVQRRELAFASRAFPSIELNGSFYSLQTPESYAAWHRETPAGFVFSVKGSRFITHIRRLKEVELPLANFLASGVFNLKEKLGPFLWQFPPFFRFDEERFDRFFSLLPRDTGQALALARRRESRMRGRARLAIDESRGLRHAVEVRHASFASEAFVALLRKHGIALVVADTAGKWPYFEDVTADFMYLRLHGDEELYASGYTEAALDRWAKRIRSWAEGGEPAGAHRMSRSGPVGGRSRDIYCYFDNDVKVRAPFDADRLMHKLGLTRGDKSFVFPDRRLLESVRASPPRPGARRPPWAEWRPRR
jgi:uncharacterized protein YecE (DUF72 family)